MSPLIEWIHIYLIPAKIFQLGMYAANLYLLNRRFKGRKWMSRPLLHRLFFTGMMGWAIYIFLDIFIFSLAAYSFDTLASLGQMQVHSGYDIEYPSLFWTNILRDVAFFAAFIMIWAYFIVPTTIKYGEAKTREMFFQKGWRITAIILITIICVANDRIKVTVYDEFIRVDTEWNGIAGFSVFFTMMVYIYAAFKTRHVLDEIRSNTDEPPIESNRLIYLSRGLLMMGVGFMILVLIALIEGAISPQLMFQLKLVMGYCVHGIWAMSPYYIYQGLKDKK
jgi:hypothetical protein